MCDFNAFAYDLTSKIHWDPLFLSFKGNIKKNIKEEKKGEKTKKAKKGRKKM